MVDKDNTRNPSSSNLGAGNSNTQSIIVSKGDGFILAFVVIFVFFVAVSLVGAYHIGVLAEKVGLIEDIIFNQEYKIERKEVKQ